MAKRPAFQFYPDSWLSSMDITLMTIAEEGAYHRLLCLHGSKRIAESRTMTGS